jgi:hypothetical protein
LVSLPALSDPWPPCRCIGPGGCWSPTARRTVGSQQPRDGYIRCRLYSSFSQFPGGCPVGQHPTARGGSGERVGATKAQPFPRAASGRDRNSRYLLLAAQPDPTYVHPPATTVALRPPIGRVLGVTVVRPSPLFRPIGHLPEPMGGGGGRILRSEFASGELPGPPFPWGKRRSRESTKTRKSGGVVGFLDSRGPGRHPLPGFGLVRGDLRTPKVSGGPGPPAWREPGFEKLGASHFLAYPRGSGISFVVVRDSCDP